VRRRIAVRECAVTGPPMMSLPRHDDAADRHLAALPAARASSSAISIKETINEAMKDKLVPLPHSAISHHQRTNYGRQQQPGQIRRANRQGDRPRRACLAPRGRGLDRRWRVAVNGEVIRSAALNVTDRDRASVDGEPLPERERTRLFLYHKRAASSPRMPTARPADHFSKAAEKPAAPDQRRAARFQYRRAPSPHQ